MTAPAAQDRRQAVRDALEALPMARIVKVTDAQVDAVLAELDAR